MTALRPALFALSLALLTTGSAFAGPPLATDDAGTVDVGRVEIELNGSYTRDKETAAGVAVKSSASDAEMKITTGLYKNLGVSLAIPYTISGRVTEDDRLVGKADGFGDMIAEIKYAFGELDGINFAVKPSVIIPTGKSGLTDDHWQFGTTLIATMAFDEGKYAVHANLGYEHHNYNEDAAGSRRNLWSGSVAGEMEVVKGFFAVADVGLATNPDKRSNDLPVYALAGARYEINDNLGINAGIRLGLTGPEGDLSVLYGLALKL